MLAVSRRLAAHCPPHLPGEPGGARPAGTHYVTWAPWENAAHWLHVSVKTSLQRRCRFYTQPSKTLPGTIVSVSYE